VSLAPRCTWESAQAWKTSPAYAAGGVWAALEGRIMDRATAIDTPTLAVS
jgi:hypothetical protein